MSNEIEQDIRANMGRAILDKAQLPITIQEGKPTYTGELSLEKYREVFPEQDNYETIYLTLLKIKPPLAEGIATIYKFNLQMEEMSGSGDYDEATKFRDKRNEAIKKLVQTLSKYEESSET